MVITMTIHSNYDVLSKRYDIASLVPLSHQNSWKPKTLCVLPE